LKTIAPPRIHAIVRRSEAHAQSVINTGDLCVNLEIKTVEANSARVHRTDKEYEMLELLSLRKGTTLTRKCSSITSMAAWTSRSSRSSASSSASSAESSPMPQTGKNYIETVWDHGQVFREPQEV
jgi:two-component system cell cycle response regulator CtrA